MWQFMAGQKIYFMMNVVPARYYPMQEMIGRILDANPASLPLWNPYLFSGSPLAADPQMQVWYPPAVLYRLLPYPAANGCFLALHLLLAVVGMAWFLRAQGLGAVAAALGGMGFGLGSHPSLALVFPPALSSYAWLPWVALFSARLADNPTARNAVGLGIAGAWLLLSGCLSYGLYAAVLAAVVMTWRLGGRKRGAVVGWRLAGSAVGLAMAASAVLLVPFAAYAREASHPDWFSNAATSAQAIPLWSLLGLVLPQGILPDAAQAGVGAALSRWSMVHYLGVWLVVLALTGWVWLRKTGRTEAPVVLVLLGVALGLKLPFAITPHPGLWMVLAGFGIAWLGALGANELEHRLRTQTGWRMLTGWTAAALFLASVWLGSKLWRLGVLERWLMEEAGPAAAELPGRLGLAIYPAVFIALGVLVLWLASRKEIAVRTALVLVAGLVWLDLLIVRLQVQPFAKAASVMAPSMTEKFFAGAIKSGGWFRVFVTPRLQRDLRDEGGSFEELTRNVRASFRSNLPAAAGLRDASGEGSLRPAQMEALVDQAARAPKPWASQAVEAFRLLGVKYLITRSRLDGPGYRLVHDQHVRVYERESRVKPVWVEPSAHGAVSGPVTTRAAGSWEFSVNLRRPATVVVSETWMKGWKLGNPIAGAQVKPVHGALIGVELPAGEHEIKLRYSPLSAKIGMAVSLLTLAGIMAAGLAALSWRRR